MKKKLTVNTLAFGNLKLRRRQYTLMIVGIVLAMVFSSGTLFFLSCMKTSAEENKKLQIGAQDSIVLNCGDLDFSDPKIADQFEIGYAHVIGYGYLSEEEREYGTAIAWLDEKATELSYITVAEGRLPERENEIAVEKSALLRMQLNELAVGDELTLTVQVADGNKYRDQSEQKTYTIVGILRDKRQRQLNMYSDSAQQTVQEFMPAAFVANGTQTAVGGRDILSGYLSFETPKGIKKYTATFDYYRLMDELCGDSSDTICLDSYMFSGSFISGLSGLVLPIILSIVLMGISCLGIINAFTTNLRERKTQIGLLRAVGATKRQIITVFGREAFWITLFSTPVSIAISYGLVRLITLFMGDSFVFAPKMWVLLVSGAVSMVFVLSAALIPLRSASRVTPMQAIRNVDVSHTVHKKKIRSQKEFSMPKLLAKRHMAFYKGKNTIMTLLLTAAIILSCCGFSFYHTIAEEFWDDAYDYRLQSFGHYGVMDYINDPTVKDGYSENDRQEILRSGYVKSVNGGKSCKINILKNYLDDYMLIDSLCWQCNMFADAEDYTPENYLEKATADFSDFYKELCARFDYEEYVISSGLCAVDGQYLEAIKDHVAEGKINIDKLNSGEEVIMVVPKKLGLQVENYGTDYLVGMTGSPDEKTDYLLLAENSFHAGDELRLSCLTTEDAMSDIKPLTSYDIKRNDKTVRIGAVIYDSTVELDMVGMGNYIRVFTTTIGMEHFISGCKYENLNIMLNTECTDEIDREMTELLERISLNTPGGDVFSDYAFANEQRQETQTILLAVMSVAVLFFLICGSMVNNSITAKISESKRTIGTLRAVGASQREIFSSYIRQLLTVFGIGTAAGFGGYALIRFGSYCAEKIFPNRYEDLFRFTVWQTAIFVVALFVVCMINMRIKIRKEMKHSIVENIREL